MQCLTQEYDKMVKAILVIQMLFGNLLKKKSETY